jgi:nucleotide-binding universal stress UspA family protein
MTIKKLLVATDLSDASYRALQCATIHAKKFQSEIILLHIFEVADVDDSAKRMMASSFLNRDIKRQLQEMVEEVSKNEGIKATYLTKEGELFRCHVRSCPRNTSGYVICWNPWRSWRAASYR